MSKLRRQSSGVAVSTDRPSSTPAAYGMPALRWQSPGMVLPRSAWRERSGRLGIAAQAKDVRAGSTKDQMVWGRVSQTLTGAASPQLIF